MMKNKTRLQFEKEDKQAPKKRNKKKAAKKKYKRTYQEALAKKKKQLKFDIEDIQEDEFVSKKNILTKAAPAYALRSQLHKHVENNSDNNVAVEGANDLTKATGNGVQLVRAANRVRQSRRMKKLNSHSRRVKGLKNTGEKVLESHSQASAGHSNPLSRMFQKKQIKKHYAVAMKESAKTAGSTSSATVISNKIAGGKKSTAAILNYLKTNKKGIGIVLAIAVVLMMLLSITSSCSVMYEGSMSAVALSTYPSDESEMLAVEAVYSQKEDNLISLIVNFEKDNPQYDGYVYDIDFIGHDPHELAAYLSAIYQSYTLSEVRDELQQIFNMQYLLTIESEVQIRTREVTYVDDEGNSTTVIEEYEYWIVYITVRSRTITSIADSQLTREQHDMFTIYRATQGNMPLLFGGGSFDVGTSTDISNVQFINGERPGNDRIVKIALAQVGNVGGQPYWSWYGFNSRVEWCACFVSWCLNQVDVSEPRFAGCTIGMGWFASNGQWGSSSYSDIAPGDIIFFDWDNSGNADHVGIVVGKDSTHVYTIEGNSGDACKVRSYPLNSSVIRGYGLMNW